MNDTKPEADALDRLLERLRRFADMNGADTQTCREAAEALVALRQELDESATWKMESVKLMGELVALREQHDALKAALRTVLATMDDGKDFHTQTEALEAARALLGNAVGEAR